MAAISSLRVAVFGISRSGKDYSIGKVREILNASGPEFVHYAGIPTVRDYSSFVLGKKFADTTMAEKGRLMNVFRKKISDREKIPFLIQDEHCCFPVTYGGRPLVNEYTRAKFPFELKKNSEGSREYEVVLREEWITDCDMIFYLRPDPDVIRKRMHDSNGSKRNTQITSEDVDLWMRFEIEFLREVCSRNKLHFEVIEGNDGAYEKISGRIMSVLGNTVPVKLPAEPDRTEYKIVENKKQTEFVHVGTHWVDLDDDDVYFRRDQIDHDIRDMERLCRKNGDKFDLDSMGKKERFGFGFLFSLAKEESNKLSWKRKEISVLSLVNERMIGDSTNSILAPHKLEDMFRINPMVGTICLGKSVRMLIEEYDREHNGSRYNNYPDLLMRLKDKGRISGKRYDLLQKLENQRRYYATNIFADAPNPKLVSDWKKLHSELLSEVFCPNVPKVGMGKRRK